METESAPAPPHDTPSRLERVLRSGRFAFTSDCAPPKGTDLTRMKNKLARLKGITDAVNTQDNPTAVVRMASWAAALLMVNQGVEPVFQVVCRDKNRLALQSDLLGVFAMGVRNILCLSGDHQSFGNHPEAQNVYDIDSIQLISLAKKMHDEGRFLNGERIERPPRFFIGAASNPFASPVEIRIPRLAKKIAAGADFIQTQCVYNMDRFRNFMKEAVDRGLTEKCAILAGVTPLKSLGMARYMATAVPGMDVPPGLIKRLAGAKKGETAEEGIRIAVEQIQEFKEMDGVAGVHLMTIEWEHRVPEIAERAGLLPRPAD
jgi:methylenetetrahydrofolate reductase (NADPH)